MKRVIQWVLTIALLLVLGITLAGRFAKAETRDMRFCQVQVSPGHPSGASCFMDEVVTGIYGNEVYCGRITVYCNR